MTVNTLNINAMLLISHTLLNAPNTDEAARRHATVARCKTSLQLAHDALHRHQERDLNGSSRRQALDRELDELCRTYNATTRGLDAGLFSAIALSPSSGESAPFEEVRRTLFPQGVPTLDLLALEQPDDGMAPPAHLTPSMLQTLSRVRIDGEALDVHVKRWGRLCHELQQRLSERTRVVDSNDGTCVGARELREARQAWLQAMSALEEAIEFAGCSEEEAGWVIDHPRIGEGVGWGG